MLLLLSGEYTETTFYDTLSNRSTQPGSLAEPGYSPCRTASFIGKASLPSASLIYPRSTGSPRPQNAPAKLNAAPDLRKSLKEYALFHLRNKGSHINRKSPATSDIAESRDVTTGTPAESASTTGSPNPHTGRHQQGVGAIQYRLRSWLSSTFPSSCTRSIQPHFIHQSRNILAAPANTAGNLQRPRLRVPVT